jgi:ribonuclease P protein component
MRASPGLPRDADPPDHGLSRAQRLTRPALFQEAFGQQQSQVGRYMVLWVRRADDAALRLGLVSSRKVGGAVQRNRARRRLREAWRLNRHRLKGRADVVLVARRAIGRATVTEVEEELMRLCRNAGLLPEPRRDG